MHRHKITDDLVARVEEVERMSAAQAAPREIYPLLIQVAFDLVELKDRVYDVLKVERERKETTNE